MPITTTMVHPIPGPAISNPLLRMTLQKSNDWRSCRLSQEQTFTVPGRIIQPINPKLAVVGEVRMASFYLLVSQALVALTASLFELLSIADLKTIPKLASLKDFPYRELAGRACFVCEDHKSLLNINDFNSYECPLCTPPVALDLSQGQRILQHVGSHILHDPKINRASDHCGLCLTPAPACQFFLKKGKGLRGNLKIDRELSKGCTLQVNYSYSVASESSLSSLCSNVPITCPLCPKTAPAVWRYNLKYHLSSVHNRDSASHHQYDAVWQLSNFEIREMKMAWSKRAQVSVKRAKKANTVPLAISDAHRSRIPLENDDSNVGADTDHDDCNNLKKLNDLRALSIGVDSCVTQEKPPSDFDTHASQSEAPIIDRDFEPDLALEVLSSV